MYRKQLTHAEGSTLHLLEPFQDFLPTKYSSYTWEYNIIIFQWLSWLNVVSNSWSNGCPTFFVYRLSTIRARKSIKYGQVTWCLTVIIVPVEWGRRTLFSTRKSRSSKMSQSLLVLQIRHFYHTQTSCIYSLCTTVVFIYNVQNTSHFYYTRLIQRYDDV